MPFITLIKSLIHKNDNAPDPTETGFNDLNQNDQTFGQTIMGSPAKLSLMTPRQQMPQQQKPLNSGVR